MHMQATQDDAIVLDTFSATFDTTHPAHLRDRVASIRAKLPKITGKRAKFSPAPITPSIVSHDVGASRTAASAADELRKLAAKHRARTDDRDAARIDRAIGRQLIPGWRVTATDGSVAVLRRETSADAADKVMDATVTPIGTLTAGAWCAYGRVRTLRPSGTKAIYWTFGRDGLTLAAIDEDGDIAREGLHMATSQDVDFLLSDQYLMPCRGVKWDVAATGNGAIVLTAGDVAIVVMGMRR